MNIEKLQQIISYNFRDISLISCAICHPGSLKYGRSLARNFERLEFLGDRVLGLALSEFLYKNFPTDSEGELATRISVLAGTAFLIDVAKKTNIMECLEIPKDFFVSPNKNSSSIADMVEAIFGAIFLDSNFETVKKIIVKLWGSDIKNVVHKKKDAKTRLQEISQSEMAHLPVYRLINMMGEAHNPIFEMEVRVLDKYAIGYGNSKKNAEYNAAGKMIKLLEKEGIFTDAPEKRTQ
ncbi:MAG: ribonuclease III [Holosporaceae bacterium]|nr:ribonuclease III [Holosporaceae bacterium]